MNSIDGLVEAELPYDLKFDESSNILYGIVKKPVEPPTDSAEPVPGEMPLPRRHSTVTGFALRQHVEQLGYQDFFFPNNSLNGFIKAINQKAEGRYILAYRKDATIEINVAKGALIATAKTTRAWGGAPLTKDIILNEIRRCKLSPDRIVRQALGELLRNTEGTQVTLAAALEPAHGKNAELIQLLRGQMMKDRDIDSSKRIDQRELFEFVVVEPGTPLLKKRPFSKGTAGIDVLGREIKPVSGKDIPFAKPFEGVEPSQGDENILVASIKGHPVFFTGGVRVDPVLSLPAVDINSGNVDYDGSVFIKGNVENGFIVSVNGDIYVQGQVERATLSAGGDITIQGGVLGSEKNEDEDYNARLTCKGDLNTKFLSQVAVECEGKVVVAEYILHSHVHATREILVGQERGRGCVIGGYCHSDTGITAKMLGTEAYVPTFVSAGSQEKYDEFLRLDAELCRRKKEEEELKQLLEFVISSQPKVTIGKLEIDKTIQIQQVLLKLVDYIAELEERLTQYLSIKEGNIKINVTGKFYPNTTVNINGLKWLCKQLISRKTLIREADQIKIKELEI